MLKKVISLIIALNILFPFQVFAQNSNYPETIADIQAQLQRPIYILSPNNIAEGILFMSAALAVGSSLPSNAHLVNRIKNIIEDKYLVNHNPAAALAKKSARLTKTFNKTVKGKANYAALSRDINMLNKRIQEFSQYASTFPKNSGFKYIPPDLYSDVNQTLRTIPKSLLKANPEIKYSINAIKSMLRKSAERMSERGIAIGAIAIMIIAIIPAATQSVGISNSRTEIRRAILQARDEGPECLTLTALVLAQHNEQMVADILLESLKAGENIYPIISTQIDIMTAPETIAEVKALNEPKTQTELETDLIKSIKNSEPFKMDFTF